MVTTVAAPETGRDAEQPQQLTRLGCGARGEPGVRSPQESRKQCEFPSNLCRGRCGVENGRKGNRGTTVKGETGEMEIEAAKILEGGVDAAVLAGQR